MRVSGMSRRISGVFERAGNENYLRANDVGYSAQLVRELRIGMGTGGSRVWVRILGRFLW